MTGGVTCQTVSQTYEAEHAKETEAQKPAGVHRTNLAGSGLSAGAPMPAAAATPAVVEGMTVRTQTDAADAVARAERQQKAAKIDGRMAALRTRPARISARAPERVLMLWILPWVDDDGDLHDASRVWMRVQDASWRIERVRNRTINGTAPGVEP